jgi:ubiquitin-like protein Pup
MAGDPVAEKQKRERVTYTRPKGESEQYEYSEKDAVRDQEEARRKQVAAEKAGAAAVKAEVSVELMDEIDSVLEENALEFMNQFIQGNGE